MGVSRRKSKDGADIACSAAKCSTDGKQRPEKHGRRRRLKIEFGERQSGDDDAAARADAPTSVDVGRLTEFNVVIFVMLINCVGHSITHLVLLQPKKATPDFLLTYAFEQLYAANHERTT